MLADNTQVSFEQLLVMLSSDGGHVLDTRSCQVNTTQAQDLTTFKVNKECNILHFSMLAFYNECKRSPGQEVRIVGEGVEVDFQANKTNCDKVNSEFFEDSTRQNEKTVQAASDVPENNYVIQFYAGKTSPNLEDIPCTTDEVSVVKVGSVYYALSSTLAKEKAQAALKRLKAKCACTGWVRRHPMR